MHWFLSVFFFTQVEGLIIQITYRLLSAVLVEAGALDLYGARVSDKDLSSPMQGQWNSQPEACILGCVFVLCTKFYTNCCMSLLSLLIWVACMQVLCWSKSVGVVRGDSRVRWGPKRKFHRRNIRNKSSLVATSLSVYSLSIGLGSCLAWW